MKFSNRSLFNALILLCAAGLLVFGAATPAARAQDLTLHESTTSTGMPRAGATNVTQTRYISSQALRNTSSTGMDSIIQFKEGKIININNNNKTYSVTTVQQLNDMLAKRMSARGGREDAEATAVMRRAMGQIAQSISVTKAGPGENIAGYATERYNISGMMPMQIWAAPALKMPAIYYDAMKMTTPQNPIFDMGKLYDEMKKIQGTALKTVITMKMMNMEMKTTTVVTSVDKTPIPASVFQIPAGYKQVPYKF